MIIPGAKPLTPVTPAAPSPQFSAQPAHPRRAFWFLRGPDPTPTPILPVVAPPPPPPASSADDKLQLTFLIAMPNPNTRTHTVEEKAEKDKGAHDEEEEEDIPEVVFGVTEVQWEGGADWKPEESIGKDIEEGKGASGTSSG